jgi:hypothetical protein
VNAYAEPQESGNSLVQIDRAFANDLRGIGPFSIGSIFQRAVAMRRKEGNTVLENYEQEMLVFRSERHLAIEDVRREFVLPSDESVIAFLDEHRTIAQILLSAAGPLKECFGADVIFTLRMPADDIGSPTLYAVVMWPGSVRDVRRALRQFDDSWWLEHLPQAAGHLSFTYELV